MRADSPGGKNKKCSQKALLGLQCYNQTKVNPRWWIKSKIEHAVARHIKSKSQIV